MKRHVAWMAAVGLGACVQTPEVSPVSSIFAAKIDPAWVEEQRAKGVMVVSNTALIQARFKVVDGCLVVVSDTNRERGLVLSVEHEVAMRGGKLGVQSSGGEFIPVGIPFQAGGGILTSPPDNLLKPIPDECQRDVYASIQTPLRKR